MITFNELGKYGRLGNQMFQIASTIGLALKHGYEFGFPKWINHDHAGRFASPEDVDIYAYFKNQLPEIEPGNYPMKRIPWGYYPDIQIPDNVSLSGHMQSEEYFKKYHQVIRHYFELNKLSDIEIEPGSIALHFRGADYGDDYHPRMTAEYYLKALELLPEGKVYVFSDDIKEIKSMLGNNIEYVEGNHYMVDLYLMTKCNYFVIANSSFSWWGAWLSYLPNKKVVIPTRWFGPACKASPKDIYPDGWIKI